MINRKRLCHSKIKKKRNINFRWRLRWNSITIGIQRKPNQAGLTDWKPPWVMLTQQQLEPGALYCLQEVWPDWKPPRAPQSNADSATTGAGMHGASDIRNLFLPNQQNFFVNRKVFQCFLPSRHWKICWSSKESSTQTRRRVGEVGRGHWEVIRLLRTYVTWGPVLNEASNQDTLIFPIGTLYPSNQEGLPTNQDTLPYQSGHCNLPIRTLHPTNQDTVRIHNLLIRTHYPPIRTHYLSNQDTLPTNQDTLPTNQDTSLGPNSQLNISSIGGLTLFNLPTHKYD